jgi:cyclopropane fatty-acyl-phospholipid synthase-like methyltransferase
LPKEKYDFVFDRGCYHHIPQEDKPEFARMIYDTLKENGVYFLSCFSDKNPPWEKNVSKEEIRTNFSPYFTIEQIKDYKGIEGPTGRIIYFYLVYMKKK